MVIYETSNYSRKFEKLIRRNASLGHKVDKKLQILVADRDYPGLRLHKIEKVGEELWSISVGLKTRILFSYVGDGILLFDIGDHDEVY